MSKSSEGAEMLKRLNKARTVLERVLEQKECFCLKALAVDGNDMKSMGIKGEKIGEALEYCLNAVIEERATNSRDSLMKLAKELYC